jgi:hypothetical protein
MPHGSGSRPCLFVLAHFINTYTAALICKHWRAGCRHNYERNIVHLELHALLAVAGTCMPCMMGRGRLVQHVQRQATIMLQTFTNLLPPQYESAGMIKTTSEVRHTALNEELERPHIYRWHVGSSTQAWFSVTVLKYQSVRRFQQMMPMANLFRVYTTLGTKVFSELFLRVSCYLASNWTTAFTGTPRLC